MLFAAWFAAGEFVTHAARTGQIRDGGGIDAKGLHAAVLLLDAHVKLAGDGIIEILNTKWTGSHLRFINHPSLLANGDFGVGFGDTGYFRRIATQVGRQHVVIAGDRRTKIAKAVKHAGIEIVLAQRGFRLERRQRPIGVKACPGEFLAIAARATILLHLPVRTQAPGTGVNATGAVAAHTLAFSAVLRTRSGGKQVVIH